MRTLFQTLPLIALLSACGSLQETANVRDDVYDVPDRTVMASKSAAAPAPEAPATSEEDYYDEGESRSSVQSERRDFYDMTYNDPYWYNYGRFGWNSPGMWGPSFGMGYGMGMGNGWSVGIGYGSGFGNPYWGNSWMSGYGAWGSPWGYGYGYPYWGGGFGNPYYGYGYGGGWGGPYHGPWGGCYGCYEPVGYGNSVVYGHRPSLNGGSGNGSSGVGNPRGYRNPAGLVDTRPSVGRQDTFEQRVRTDPAGRNNSRTLTPADRPSRNTGFGKPSRTPRPATRPSTPSRTFDGGGGSSPSRGGGGSGGGGGRTSPRPR
ncbi:MAG TPA: hypothetical protein VGE21_02605 [Flavobacteriales bacterium]